MITILLITALVMSGCQGQPVPSSPSGAFTTKQSIASGNDVNALGVDFESLISLHVGDTINISNSDGASVAPHRNKKTTKREK